MFILERKSQFTGKINTMVIPMDRPDFIAAEERWLDGMLIQKAFPNFTADMREFLMTGATTEEWNELFGGDA